MPRLERINMWLATTADMAAQLAYFAGFDSLYSSSVLTYSNRFSDVARSARAKLATQGETLSLDLANDVTLHSLDSKGQAQIAAFTSQAENAIHNI